MDLNSSSPNTTPLASLAYVPLGFIYTLGKKRDERFYVEHVRIGAVLSLFFLMALVLFLFFSKFLGVLLGMFWAVPSFMSAAKAWDHGKAGYPGLNWALQIPLGNANGFEGPEDEEVLDAPLITPGTPVEPKPTEPSLAPSVELMKDAEMINPAAEPLIKDPNSKI